VSLTQLPRLSSYDRDAAAVNIKYEDFSIFVGAKAASSAGRFANIGSRKAGIPHPVVESRRTPVRRAQSAILSESSLTPIFLGCIPFKGGLPPRTAESLSVNDDNKEAWRASKTMGLDITGRYRYPAPRAAWLAQHVEPVIDPDLPIIDPHHHIWEEAGNPYLLDDLIGDLDTGHRIEATVFVQAHYGYRTSGPEELRCVGETEKATALAEEAQRRNYAPAICAGIVGFADLLLGSGVARVLEAHVEAGKGRFRGVRHSVSRDTNFPDGIVLRPAQAGLLGDATYREGLAAIARGGLSYDCMCYHQQIPELTAMARAVPDLAIVLDHYGTILGVAPKTLQHGAAISLNSRPVRTSRSSSAAWA
jgi:predicted TIM-barrel fold metal-dependent hydrolase